MADFIERVTNAWNSRDITEEFTATPPNGRYSDAEFMMVAIGDRQGFPFNGSDYARDFKNAAERGEYGIMEASRNDSTQRTSIIFSDKANVSVPAIVGNLKKKNMDVQVIPEENGFSLPNQNVYALIKDGSDAICRAIATTIRMEDEKSFDLDVCIANGMAGSASPITTSAAKKDITSSL